MKFCQPHWNALRKAIELRGLSHLGAKTGQDAAKRAVTEIQGTATDRTFDPLMATHNMILSHATEHLGLALFTGDYCPVCELLKVYPPIPDGHRYSSNESYLIDGPADAVLQERREKGLVLAQ